MRRNEKKPVDVTCSVGAAMYPEHGEDFRALYRSADLALYQAKSLWTKVRIVPIKWGNRDAYLISCFDITEYKQLQENKI